MQENRDKIIRTVLEELAKEGQRYVPVGISARHVHLCQKDLDTLFGTGYQLRFFKELSQPGQFASQERVTLEGPKGRLENVRILGPVRSKTQVEISLTDSLQLGVKNLSVRMSGDLDGTPGIRLIGPKGAIDLPAGTIAAARHVHMSESQARAYQVHDGQRIALKVGGSRPCLLENVVCRTGKGHELELHVDTDEANACGLKNGDLLEVYSSASEYYANNQVHGYGNAGTCRAQDPAIDPAKISQRAAASLMGCPEPESGSSGEILELVTEDDVNHASRTGRTCIYCTRSAIITPAAADRLLHLGIEAVRADMAGADNAKSSAVKLTGSEEILDLVTAQDLNVAFRDNKTQIYCTANALITPAAQERIEETGIRIIRI